MNAHRVVAATRPADVIPVDAPVVLDWTRKRECNRCGIERECFACYDGLRCRKCRPRNWSPPPDAVQWLAQFHHLLHPTPLTRRTHYTREPDS